MCLPYKKYGQIEVHAKPKSVISFPRIPFRHKFCQRDLKWKKPPFKEVKIEHFQKGIKARED